MADNASSQLVTLGAVAVGGYLLTRPGADGSSILDKLLGGSLGDSGPGYGENAVLPSNVQPGGGSGEMDDFPIPGGDEEGGFYSQDPSPGPSNVNGGAGDGGADSPSWGSSYSTTLFSPESAAFATILAAGAAGGYASRRFGRGPSPPTGTSGVTPAPKGAPKTPSSTGARAPAVKGGGTGTTRGVAVSPVSPAAKPVKPGAAPKAFAPITPTPVVELAPPSTARPTPRTPIVEVVKAAPVKAPVRAGFSPGGVARTVGRTIFGGVAIAEAGVLTGANTIFGFLERKRKADPRGSA